MPISVQVRKETGEVVRTGEQPFRIVTATLDARAFPLLWGVDRYGDTVFNRRQVGLLAAEIRRLSEQQLGPDERNSLDEVSGLCRETLSRPHRYLWFRGD